MYVFRCYIMLPTTTAIFILSRGPASRESPGHGRVCRELVRAQVEVYAGFHPVFCGHSDGRLATLRGATPERREKKRRWAGRMTFSFLLLAHVELLR